MRIGNLDHLLLKLDAELSDDARYIDIADHIRDIINNAPTVELDECVIQEVLNKRCMTAVANEYLIALHGKRPQGEWIPCSERLPDDMKKVLVWYEYYRYGDFNCMYQTYGFCYVCDGKWSPFINGETGWTDARIIAWQPLPEPYDSEVHDD